MIYTINFDLFIDDDNIYSENDLRDFLRERISGSAIGVKHVKLIDIND